MTLFVLTHIDLREMNVQYSIEKNLYSFTYYVFYILFRNQ